MVASVPLLAMRGSGYISGRVCQAQSDPGVLAYGFCILVQD